MASDGSFSWRRSVAWALSLALHLVAVVAMTRPPESVAPAAIVGFSAPLAWVPVNLPNLRREPSTMESAHPRGETSPQREARAPSARDSSLRRANAMPREVRPIRPDAAAPVPRATSFLDDEARALLPQESVYTTAPSRRDGDYYTPGDGSEDDVLYRPRALDPAPSRFAQVWSESRGTVVDEWLGKVLEKATGTVSIPLNPKFNLVCGTVAGLVGSCAIVRDGGTGVIVQRPPPAPWERSNRVQCRELRQALEDAEEAVQVAYFVDRLSALCSADAEVEGNAPGEAPENDEARREAGLPEDHRMPRDAADEPQRAL